MSSTQTTLSIADRRRTDRDGDRLTYLAQLAIDPLAPKAYTLDQQLKLSPVLAARILRNLLGDEEKYPRGANGTWYFILPNGGLYRWAEPSPAVR